MFTNQKVHRKYRKATTTKKQREIEERGNRNKKKKKLNTEAKNQRKCGRIKRTNLLTNNKLRGREHRIRPARRKAEQRERNFNKQFSVVIFF